MKILLAQINPTIGNIAGNSKAIIAAIGRGKSAAADLVIFPELAVTGYPPEDFLLMPHFIDAVEAAIDVIAAASRGISVIVGLPRRNNTPHQKPLFNSAAIIVDGDIIGYQDKTLLPTYDVFDELRYFEPAKSRRLWPLCGSQIAVTICEDIWRHNPHLEATHPDDPVTAFKESSPDIALNISCSPFHATKLQERIAIAKRAAESFGCPLLLCNQVGGNDSLIFDGSSFYIGKGGRLLAIAPSFQEADLFVDTKAELEEISAPNDTTQQIHDALVLGIRDYCRKTGLKRACIGLSGGIDSALVACLATEALGKENILGVMMPSRYSSPGSLEDATAIADTLGIASTTVPIEEPFTAFESLLSPHFQGREDDTTEENLQARIRGNILMAFSNKFGYIVLSTGNKSEMAMGYATLYGDMCGGLGVINDLTKEQVYSLSRWINRNGDVIPKNSIEKAPSAELRPGQKDSDSLPDYAIVDTVLQAYIEEHLSAEAISGRYAIDLALVQELIKRIHFNEYKRRQAPPGIRISSKAFSVGRRFPIAQGWL